MGHTVMQIIVCWYFVQIYQTLTALHNNQFLLRGGPCKHHLRMVA